MRTKTNSGSVVLKAAAIVLGACLTIIGMTSASGDLVTILKLAGAEGGFVSFAKTLISSRHGIIRRWHWQACCLSAGY